jgi:predicted nucleotidyltransferase
MSRLPVQSVRALPEHRPLLQAAAEFLRAGGAEALRRFLEDARSRPVGPVRSEADALQVLTDRLVAALRPRAVWLFGSRARGDARPDSDFDLMVVLPDGLPERAYSYEAVREPVLVSGVACDVVPCAWSDFVAARDAIGTLVRTVVREGRPLYIARDLAEAA